MHCNDRGLVDLILTLCLIENQCKTTNPCSSHGECVFDEEIGDFIRCDCNNIYKGVHCELERTCDTVTGPCKNGAVCVEGEGENEYTCALCPDGFIGFDCEHSKTVCIVISTTKIKLILLHFDDCCRFFR